MFDDIKKLQAQYDQGIKDANIMLQEIKNQIHHALDLKFPMGTKVLVQITERDRDGKSTTRSYAAVVDHIEGDFLVCEDNIKAKWDEVRKVLS